MDYIERFHSVDRKLFELDAQNLTDFWLESFNGYYGILELKGIQGFVSSKNRESVAYLEIYATPDDVRKRNPKQYGDIQAEVEAMDIWIRRLTTFGLGSHYDELNKLIEVDFKVTRMSSITNSPYLIFFRSLNLLYKVSINPEGVVSGLSIYNITAVLLEDGSARAQALASMPYSATLLEYFE